MSTAVAPAPSAELPGKTSEAAEPEAIAVRAPKIPATPDSVLAKLVEQARQALHYIAFPEEIGDHEGVLPEGERLVAHYFTCTKPGYVGWHWTVTMARAPRSRTGTICELNLLPSEGALLAPPWIPWADRLEPGDLSRGDQLPRQEDDPNLEQGYEATGVNEEADQLALWELGLGRRRVLSAAGRDAAARRWARSSRGPAKEAATLEDSTCSSCGYLSQLAGTLRQQFGVCANGWSPDDGTVVSLEHTCGAHSETDVEPTETAWPDNAPQVDEGQLAPLQLAEEAPAEDS